MVRKYILLISAVLVLCVMPTRYGFFHKYILSPTFARAKVMTNSYYNRELRGQRNSARQRIFPRKLYSVTNGIGNY